MEKYDVKIQGKEVYIKINTDTIIKDDVGQFSDDLTALIHKHDSRFNRIHIDATEFPRAGFGLDGDWSKIRLEFLLGLMCTNPKIYVQTNEAFYLRYEEIFGDALVGTAADGYRINTE